MTSTLPAITLSTKGSSFVPSESSMEATGTPVSRELLCMIRSAPSFMTSPAAMNSLDPSEVDAHSNARRQRDEHAERGHEHNARVSASHVAYCCANRTEIVLVGIVLATKAACDIAPDTPANLIMMKNRAGWTIRDTSEPTITVGDVSLTRCAARTRPLAKIATPAADTARGLSAVAV